MKRVLVLTFLLLVSMSAVSAASVDVGMSFGNGGSSFFLSIGDYFHVPQKEVIVVKERKIPDEEIPVVFFLAQRVNVAPAAIIDLRLKGQSWLDITLHFGQGPEIFYVPVKESVVFGPPYGKAYGHYKKKSKKEWKKIRLQDDDVVNLVNLRFISEHYKYEPETVIKMREGGRKFSAISGEIEKEKGKGRKEDRQAKEEKKEHKKADKPDKEEKQEKGEKKEKGKGKKH